MRERGFRCSVDSAINLQMRLLMISVLLAAPLCGQDQTGQMSNGRVWEIFNDLAKTSYMSAIKDAVIYSAFTESIITKQDIKNIVAEKWAIGFNVGDYIKELDLIYKDRENIRLPITIAVSYCTMKLKGQSSKEELEQYLITLRTIAAGLK